MDILELGDNNAVLFSGGRDSTLVAAMLLLNAEIYRLELLTMTTGFGWGPNMRSKRLEELRDRFRPKEIISSSVDVRGIVKEIGIVNIEDDFRRFGVNTVPMAEAISVLAGAIVHCRQNNISHLFNGYTGYQSQFTEQSVASLKWLQEWCGGYGVTLISPIININSEEVVKKHLRLLAISPKSMEGNYMFADSFSMPEDHKIVEFYESKRDEVDEIIGFWESGIMLNKQI